MSGTRTRRPRNRDNAPPPVTGGGPFPQDPTACLRPDPAASRLRSTPPTPRRNGVRVQYWEPADSGPAELVSVPPSSTTPETSDPPQLVGRHVLSAALDRPPYGEPASAP